MKGRRGKNEGNIKRRTDGRWEARISLPDGQRKSIYGKTRQEVSRKLSQGLHAKEEGTLQFDDRQTVKQYLTTWLDATSYQLKPSSVRRYRNAAHHLIKWLGRVPLMQLTPQQVQAAYAKMLNGLAPKTVYLFHRTLHRALADGVRLGVVPRNVTDLVKSPRVEEKLMRVLSLDEIQCLLQSVKGDRLEALYVLELSTGMREGEILGLQWQDIDFANKRLTVHMGLSEEDSSYVLASPKTRQSKRVIALTQRAVDALIAHRSRQETERQLLGSEWDSRYNLVFANPWGRFIDSKHFSVSVFRRVLRRAGIPYIKFHNLRHTVATQLLSRGVNVKVVSELLGHANVSITLRIYAHVLPHMQDTAIEVMEDVLREK